MYYNLIRNSNFTSSGTMSLVYSDIYKLQDGNTTSSGVAVSGTNDLLVDLSQRIKIDDIRLYTDDGSKSGNIYFYYKNFAEDEYVLLTTYSGADYYYANVPTPSAPQFIKATISGIDITLYEFEVLNDDYDVAYGEDGELYDTYLANTPIGTQGTPEAIPIYNNGNSSIPINAYTCVEYSGDDSDLYIQLASNINGPYKGIEDGVSLQDNLSTSEYTWNMGRFNHTIISGDGIAVGTSSMPTAFTLHQDLGDIPLTTNTYSWYVGSNGWDYDDVNRIVYAVGNQSNASLHLYKRRLEDTTWSYVSELNAGGGASEDTCMCYLNGYIYVLYNTSGGMGRYDLNGSQNNWTTLSGAGFTSTYVTKMGMCGDRNRYIYAITHYYSDNTHVIFTRYDSITNTWLTRNTNYTNGASADASTESCALAYDYDRNHIYLSIGRYHTPDYIQRYIVSTNTWQTTWLDFLTLGGETYPRAVAITYYKNFIFMNPGAGDILTMLYYNVDTGQHGSLRCIYGAFWTSGANPYRNNYLLATDGISGDSVIGLFGSQLANAPTKCYYWEYPIVNTSNTYTTPVFELSSPDESSYFYIDGDTSISGSSISYTPEAYNGTIRVCSFDTKPLSIHEVLVYYLPATSNAGYVAKWIPYNNEYTDNIFIDAPWYSGNHPFVIAGMCANPINGRFAISVESVDNNDVGTCDRSYVQIYDRNFNLRASTYTEQEYYYYFNDKFEFEGENGIWGYNNRNSIYGRYLRHMDENLNLVYSYSESQQDFLYDLCTEKQGRGCWYTNSMDNTLIHMATNGYKMQVLYLESPRFVAATNDNGVWVYDTVEGINYFVRYNSSGVQVNAVAVPFNETYGANRCSCMTHDFENGIWYRYGDYIYHMTENGVFDLGPVFVNSPNQLRGNPEGCFVHSTTLNIMSFLSRDGSISSHSMPNSESSLIGMFYHSYEDHISLKSNLIPIEYDPIWGINSRWQEVSKDGYFLPKKKYHQAEITLNGDAKLNKVVMAPSIKLEDIAPGQSKDVYVRTNIPIGNRSATYETQIRTWWGVSE